jgi:hypothetical protein
MNIMTGVFIMVAVASLVHAWKISKKLSWLEGFEAGGAASGAGGKGDKAVNRIAC